MKTYIAFLRGINVGGHHKVPMAELRETLGVLGFDKVVTLLNSGNVIFEAPAETPKQLEEKISTHLEKVFGFPIPVLIRDAAGIEQLHQDNPFEAIPLTKDIRWYVSFLREPPTVDLDIPWTSEDKSFQILDIRDQVIISVLDLSIAKTPKAMEALEKMYGKGITTRNWKTIERIVKKL